MSLLLEPVMHILFCLCLWAALQTTDILWGQEP